MELYTRLIVGVVVLCSLSNAAVENNKISPREQPLPVEYEDLGSTTGGEVEDNVYEYQGVQGRAGIDFPMLQRIPKTKFSCRKMKSSGYFADLETGCQVFHLCEGGRKMSFLCPNGTIFLQSKLTCDWWFKVDCQSSEDFYESSSEQLRHDRAIAGTKEYQDQIITTRRPVFATRKSVPSSTVADDSTEAPSTFKPIRVKPYIQHEPIVQKSSWLESSTLKFAEESQELSETGSYIIAKRRMDIAAIRNTDPPPTQAPTTAEPVTETYIIPYKRLELPTKIKNRITTTENYETTTYQTTTQQDSVTDSESLIASQSSWYTGPTNIPTTTVRNYEETKSFYTVPDTTLLPPTSLPPQESYESAQTIGYSGRSIPTDSPDFTNLPLTDAPQYQHLTVTDNILDTIATERTARGFVANPKSRPGLNNLPFSASPQALHSLVRYFAADNQTRQELEKNVPAGTMELMASLMPKIESTENIDKLTPDLRQLAQIFSKALSDYLHDPETFRQTLTSIRPTHPPPTQNLITDDEKDEVLDFSDNFTTKQRKTPVTTTTEYIQETTTNYPTTTERQNKNEVASIVNEILQDPIDITARKIPSGPTQLTQETQYRYPSTPRDINLLTYLPAQSIFSSTTAKPLDNNFVENIPSSTTVYPYTPEPIPLIPESDVPYPEYVEIGYPKSRISSTTPRNYYAQDTNDNFRQPSLDSVLTHFAPHDLNSLAIFSVHTNPSPSPLSPPVSVSVHLPSQRNNIRHHVTVLTSSHNNKSPITTYRPMISKLLFPLPTVNIDDHFDKQESLVSENTENFPAKFRKEQTLKQNSNKDYIKSWLNEERSVSQLLTENIPTTFAPATTVDPVTEKIPDLSTTQDYIATTTEDVPLARKIPDDNKGSKLVLLLVKNGATTEPTETISRTKLLEALLQNTASRNNDDMKLVQVSSTTITANATSSPLTITTPKRSLSTKQPEITTYRSANHQKIVNFVHSSSEEILPKAEAFIQSGTLSQNLKQTEKISVESKSTTLDSKLPPLAVANSTHSDSRAFNILKSLYSLASRWGK